MPRNNILIFIVLFVLYLIFNKPLSTYSIPQIAGNQCWIDVTYARDLQMWVAVGYVQTGQEYGSSAYSYDSYHWTTTDAASGGLPLQSWQSVAYGNGIFVACAQMYNGPNLGPPGTSNYTVATSTDGITWNANNSLATYTAWKVHFDSINNEFIACGSGNAISAYSSPDGINWSFINNFVAFVPSAICDGPNELMVVGTNSGTLIVPLSYKYDQITPGSTFQSYGSNIPSVGYINPWYKCVKYINGTYYAGVSSPASSVHFNIYKSIDGIQWVAVPTNPHFSSVNVIDYFNGLYIVGTNNAIYYSTDMYTFQKASITGKGGINPTASAQGVNVGGVDKIVITCCNNYYFGAVTSKDGMMWSPCP